MTRHHGGEHGLSQQPRDKNSFGKPKARRGRGGEVDGVCVSADGTEVCDVTCGETAKECMRVSHTPSTTCMHSLCFFMKKQRVLNFSFSCLLLYYSLGLYE